MLLLTFFKDMSPANIIFEVDTFWNIKELLLFLYAT